MGGSAVGHFKNPLGDGGIFGVNAVVNGDFVSGFDGADSLVDHGSSRKILVVVGVGGVGVVIHHALAENGGGVFERSPGVNIPVEDSALEDLSLLRGEDDDGTNFDNVPNLIIFGGKDATTAVGGIFD